MEYCQTYNTVIFSEKIEMTRTDNSNLFLSVQMGRTSRATGTETGQNIFIMIQNRPFLIKCCHNYKHGHEKTYNCFYNWIYNSLGNWIYNLCQSFLNNLNKILTLKFQIILLAFDQISDHDHTIMLL